MFAALDPAVTGVIVVVVAAFLAVFFAFLGWVAKEMYRTTSLLNRLEERSEDQERRLRALEAVTPPWEVRRGAGP